MGPWCCGGPAGWPWNHVGEGVPHLTACCSKEPKSISGQAGGDGLLSRAWVMGTRWAAAYTFLAPEVMRCESHWCRDPSQRVLVQDRLSQGLQW